MFNTNDIREKEDLSPAVDSLFLNSPDSRFLTFINSLRAPSNPITAQKHEWQDLAARVVTIQSGVSGEGLLWDADDATADLTINAGDTDLLRVGDVLLLGDALEVVVVKSIDVAADTIAVYARGHGSTSGAAQGETAFDIKIIGNAQIEDADPIDANFQGLTPRFNYTQIFEDVADESGTLRRSSITGGNLLDLAVSTKLKELLRTANRAIIFGIKNLDTSNKIATMGGLREILTSTKNIGGALTIALLESLVVQCIDAGGNPTHLHASPGVVSKISQLYVGNVRYKTGDNRVGLSVGVVSIAGLDIELMPDRDITSSEMLLLDHSRVKFGPLNGGTKDSGDWATYQLDKNLKQNSKQVGGEFTLEVRNPAGAGVRAYGIS